jgi:formylglycine-generating enzyme required for sulfatase activity
VALRDPSDNAYVIRGGHFGVRDTTLLHVTFRTSHTTTKRESGIGFRCARDP